MKLFFKKNKRHLLAIIAGLLLTIFCAGNAAPEAINKQVIFCMLDNLEITEPDATCLLTPLLRHLLATPNNYIVLTNTTLLKKALSIGLAFSAHHSIRQVSRDLFLFIPERLMLHQQNSGTKQSRKTLSQQELALGLKIDHLRTLSPKQCTALIDSRAIGDNPYALQLKKALWDDTNNLEAHSKLFVTKQEYATHKMFPVPLAIVCGGRGEEYFSNTKQLSILQRIAMENPDLTEEITAQISEAQRRKKPTKKIARHGKFCGLQVHDCRNLLEFLAQQTNTFAFIALTCYESITDAKEIIAELKKNIASPYAQIPHTFPLITGSISATDLKIGQKKWSKQLLDIYFNNLHTQLTRANLFPEKILSALHSAPVATKNGKDALAATKFPSTDWMMAPEIAARSTVFTNAFIAQHPRETALQVTGHSDAPQQNIIRLYAQVYPETIHINKKTPTTPLPLFLTMHQSTPKTLRYTFHHIDAPDYAISQVLQSFCQAPNTRAPHVVHIKTITALPNLFDKNTKKSATIGPVVIIVTPNETTTAAKITLVLCAHAEDIHGCITTTIAEQHNFTEKSVAQLDWRSATKDDIAMVKKLFKTKKVAQSKQDKKS